MSQKQRNNTPSEYYKSLDLYRFDFDARKRVREFKKQCNRTICKSHEIFAIASPKSIKKIEIENKHSEYSLALDIFQFDSVARNRVREFNKTQKQI